MPRMRQIAVVAFIFLFAASTYAQRVFKVEIPVRQNPYLWLPPSGETQPSGSSEFIIDGTNVRNPDLDEVVFSASPSWDQPLVQAGPIRLYQLGPTERVIEHLDMEADKSPLKNFARRFKKLGLDLLSSGASLGELGERVVIGRLDRFPVATDSPALLSWQEEFENGAMGALVGVTGTSVAKFQSYFEARWKKAPIKQRIFISYTGDDLSWAKKVKSVLDPHYVTFIYQNKSGEPRYDPQKAGKFFAESGHRYVIICKKSLQSGGVIFEHLLDLKLDNLGSN